MYKFSKGKRKILSLFIAFTMVLGLISTPYTVARAETSEDVIILNEGFTGTKAQVFAGEGWILNPTNLGGYDSDTNYGLQKPSAKLDGTGKYIESPSFTLEGEGKLTFWVKGQNGLVGSELYVKAFKNDNWDTLDTLSVENGKLGANRIDTIEVAIPKDYTKIRLEYKKGASNVSIDDIKLVGVKGDGGTDPVDPPVGEVITIAQARSQAEKTVVKVKGIITFKEESGKIDNVTAYNYAIQDATAGIAIRGTEELQVGDEVTIEGPVTPFNGLTQIVYTSIKNNSSNNTLPGPKVVTISNIIDGNGGENYESQRVKLVGVKLGKDDGKGNTAIIDGQDITKTINIYKAPTLVDVVEGDKIDVTGLCSQYAKTGTGGYQIRVIASEDIVKSQPEVDKVGPVLQQVSPLGSTTNTKPEIKVAYTDESGVDTSKVTISLDGTDVTSSAKITETSVTFNPQTELSISTHTVKVVVYDTLGNSNELTFDFKVDEKVSSEGKTHYYGQLHSHTANSDGQGTVEEALNHAKNEAALDFFSITDHSNSLDDNEWSNQRANAKNISKDGDFIALYGWEMTWSKPLGHMNTFNTDWLASREEARYKTSETGMKNFYEDLKTKDGAFAQFNHPGITFGDFYNFSAYDAAIDNKVNLIEVGNGEGDVHQSGYFPSYEYYTKALDQGWHVSPTNNQDNHKKEWGTANDARTVVIADELTREAIVDAVNNNRVYSSEDKNLKLDFEINGNMMGSKLGDTKELQVDIKVIDEDVKEKIVKVEIIGNGGKVVASKTGDSNVVQWNHQITGDTSSYYYVRTTQADKDIAVSAPIWIGTQTNYGMNELKADKVLYGNDETVKLTATLTNNSFDNLSGIKVDFYKNEISEGTKIGTVENQSVASGKTTSVEFSYDAKEVGKYTIYAVATFADGEAFTQSTAFEVKNAATSIKVVIDASHGNSYVIAPDKYADGLKNVEALLNAKGMLVDYAKNGLTDEALEGASFLILTDPAFAQGGKNYNYTDVEAAAVKRFTDKGGDILITSKSDYGENGTPAADHSAAQSNKILEAIGANLRFNDDQMVDEVNSYGASHQILIKECISTKYDLAKGTLGKDYRVYSGNSVILKEGGSDAKVDWIAKANDTTYNMSNDTDVAGVYTKFNKGDEFYAAAAEQVGDSRIFLAGSTFISNFEVGPGTEDYANGEIFNNVVNWFTAIEEITPIKDLRVDENNDGIPDLKGEKFAVEGYVTVDSEKYSKTSGKPNAFFGAMVIQDETAGITLFPVLETELKVGQKVRITGTVDSYENDFQLVIDNEKDTVILLDENVTEVAPKVMSTLDAAKKNNEGWLVKVEGTVKEIGANNEGYMILNDGTGDVRVFINGYVGSSDGSIETGKFNPDIKVGDKVSAMGIASSDPQGARIRVRDSKEVIVTQPASTDVEITILHTNDSHGRVKADSSIIGIDTISAIKKSFDNSLLVDAGDTLHGLPFATLNRGADIVNLMKLAGYDLMAPGNHDFNYGYERLLQLADLAAEGENGFNIISANVLKEDKSILLANEIKVVNGVKVGFFGLTSPETAYKTNPNNVIGLDFADPILIAKQQVESLKAQGVDVIIALAHIGTDKSSEVQSTMIAEQVEGIDVIIDGHSHSKFENGFESGNGTLIVSTGEYEANLGKLSLTIDSDTKEIKAKSGSLITKAQALGYTPDQQISEAIKAIDKEQSVELSVVVGNNLAVLDGARENNRAKETNLGNLLADAMLYETEADIAITNGGGIRASINVGEITRGEIIAVLPFGNYIVTKYLTGAQIKAVLEHGVRVYPELNGGFTQIGGMNFVFDETKPAGERVIKMTINGKAIDMDKKYLVATNDFLAVGGDGFTAFKEAPTENEFRGLNEALEAYIGHLGDVNYTKDDRITIDTLENVENQATADKVIEMINNLPEKLTLKDKEQVEAARKAYNALTDAQKAFISKELVSKLEKAEDEIKNLEEEAANQAEADKVIEMINNLPEKLTLKDKEQVEAARKAYNALTDAQKAIISKELVNKLEKAEKDIKKLEKDAAKPEKPSKPDKDKLPQTGQSPVKPFYVVAAAMLIGLGAVVYKKRNNTDKKAE